jgi:hypothetical protein
MSTLVAEFANTNLVDVTPGHFDADNAVPTLTTPFAALACPEAVALTVAGLNATAVAAQTLAAAAHG